MHCNSCEWYSQERRHRDSSEQASEEQGLWSQAACISLWCLFPAGWHSVSYFAFLYLHLLLCKMRITPRLSCKMKSLDIRKCSERCVVQTRGCTSTSCFFSSLGSGLKTWCPLPLRWDSSSLLPAWSSQSPPGSLVSASRAETSILPPPALLTFMPTSSRLPTCFIWLGWLLLMLKLAGTPRPPWPDDTSALQPPLRAPHPSRVPRDRRTTCTWPSRRPGLSPN